MTIQTNDGLHLHTINWLPATTPRAIVLLVHGLGEHSGRYAHVATALTAAGYGVYAVDHRGHGQSDGPRTYIPSIQHPVDDLGQFFRQIQADHPDQPIIVFGHSMGALIGLLFVLSHQDELAGFISSGSPLDSTDVLPGFLVSLVRLISRIAPRLPVGPLDVDALSRDPAVVADYKADPLNYTSPHRAGTLAAIFNGSQQARQRLSQLSLPLYVYHGTDDQICPPSATQIIYHQSTSDDKLVKLYEGLYHEAHNEPEKNTVITDIISWLSART